MERQRAGIKRKPHTTQKAGCTGHTPRSRLFYDSLTFPAVQTLFAAYGSPCSRRSTAAVPSALWCSRPDTAAASVAAGRPAMRPEPALRLAESLAACPPPSLVQFQKCPPWSVQRAFRTAPQLLQVSDTPPHIVQTHRQPPERFQFCFCHSCNLPFPEYPRPFILRFPARRWAPVFS